MPRQQPRGQDGTIFVTIEDETGDAQIILWTRVFARCRRELGSQVVEVRGDVSRWDGTTNVIVSDLRAVRSGVSMPGPRTTGVDVWQSRPEWTRMALLCVDDTV